MFNLFFTTTVLSSVIVFIVIYIEQSYKHFDVLAKILKYIFIVIFLFSLLKLKENNSKILKVCHKNATLTTLKTLKTLKEYQIQNTEFYFKKCTEIQKTK